MKLEEKKKTAIFPKSSADKNEYVKPSYTLLSVKLMFIKCKYEPVNYPHFCPLLFVNSIF